MADFFNRIPAVILIPVVLLIAFAIAAFFIWAGIELSPVVEKVPQDVLNNNGRVQDNQNLDNIGKNSNSVPGRVSEDTAGLNSPGSSKVGSGLNPEPDSSAISETKGNSSVIPSNVEEPLKQSDQGDNGNLRDPSASVGMTSGSNENNDQGFGGTANLSGDDTSQAPGSGDRGNNSNANQNSSDGGSEEQGGGGTQQECYHPPGDVRKWWNKATPKQKECYISQHGMPDFGRQVPYFCDYNNSEDCYYK